MSQDTLTVKELAESMRELTRVVEVKYTEGDVKTAVLQRIAENQAALGSQFNQHREETNRRFDSLSLKVDTAAETANEAISILRTKKNGDPVLVRLDSHDRERTEREKDKAGRKDVSLKIITAVAIAILLGMGSLILQAFRNPTQAVQQGLSDEDRKAIVDDVVKALSEQKSQTVDPLPQPPSRRPPNANRRPMPPAGPGAREGSEIAKKREPLIANGLIAVPFILNPNKARRN